MKQRIKERITAMSLVEKILWTVGVLLAVIAVVKHFVVPDDDIFDLSIVAILLFVVCYIIGGIRENRAGK